MLRDYRESEKPRPAVSRETLKWRPHGPFQDESAGERTLVHGTLGSCEQGTAGASGSKGAWHLRIAWGLEGAQKVHGT